MAVYFIVALIGGLLCAGLSTASDRNPAGWFVIGFLLPVVGIILLLVLPNPKEVEARVRAVLEAERRPPAAPPRTPAALDAPPEDRAAKEMLAAAQRHHFAKEFAEARRIYAALVELYPHAKEAAVARRQLGNLQAV